ncbi:MAG TPA: hypothetical protein VJ183_07225 [Chloroflexia bacterium]|nr:hypothetical protein [Chloroflexia bacterium]
MDRNSAIPLESALNSSSEEGAADGARHREMPISQAEGQGKHTVASGLSFFVRRRTIDDRR